MTQVLTDDEVRANIAANVRRLLDRDDLSMRELARRTGESPMTISTICAGKHVPGVGILSRIADVFDTTLDRLVNPPAEKIRTSA